MDDAELARIWETEPTVEEKVEALRWFREHAAELGLPELSRVCEYAEAILRGMKSVEEARAELGKFEWAWSAFVGPWWTESGCATA